MTYVKVNIKAKNHKKVKRSKNVVLENNKKNNVEIYKYDRLVSSVIQWCIESTYSMVAYKIQYFYIIK